MAQRAGGRGTRSPRPNGTICEGQVPRDPASMALDSTQSALEVKTPSVCCLHPERMASTPREDLRNRLQAGKRYHPLPGYKTCLGGPKTAKGPVRHPFCSDPKGRERDGLGCLAAGILPSLEICAENLRSQKFCTEIQRSQRVHEGLRLARLLRESAHMKPHLDL